MKVGTFSPVAGLTGSLGGSDVVYFVRGGRTMARQWVEPAQPRTDEQQLAQGMFGGGIRGWVDLGDSERAAWQRFAPVVLGADAAVRRGASAGQDAFRRVNQFRASVGLAMIAFPPVLGVP